MGLFSGRLLNVIEWNEDNDNIIFHKWENDEIRRGSRLVLRPGQNAIFLSNGRLEGVFEDEGDYDIETQIIPLLSSLKGFKFGFSSGMRAEVLFVNTKVFQERWGTKGPINIPAPGMPGGLPIRANGTYCFKVNDYMKLVDTIAGIRNDFSVNDVKLRITTIIDELLMKWIQQRGQDMFNLMANSQEIGNAIRDDLCMRIFNTGMTVTEFVIASFNYPEDIQDAINKNAASYLVGDIGSYKQKGDATVCSARPNFCPVCGCKAGDSNFCPNCGNKLI